MSDFWQRLWLLLLTLFNRIENHTKREPAEPHNPVQDVQRQVEQAQQEAKLLEEDIQTAQEADAFPVPWQLPLLRSIADGYPKHTVSANRETFYKTYGRPMKVKDKALAIYPKTKAHVEEDLPGTWNHNKPRLYMMTAMVPRFRMWLQTLVLLGLLHTIKTIGCFNTRRIQFKGKGAPWSFHASAAAIDVNDAHNKARHAQDDAPLPMPFSKEWVALYPKGLDFWTVCSLKMLGFEWGGDWGRHKWMYLVFRYGVGYDLRALARNLPDNALGRYFCDEAVAEWRTCTYTDPMHAQFAHERKRSGQMPWDDDEAFYPEDDNFEELFA